MSDTTAAAPARFRILPDQPLAPADEQQFDARSRLDPIKAQLGGLLSDWLSSGQSKRPAAPPRIGLFGGLGQGKSSVVQLVLADLRGKTTIWQRAGEVLRGARVRRFEVSHFKADDLEWRFLTAVVWRRTYINLICMAVVAILLLLIAAAVGLVIGWWSWSGFWSNPDWVVRLRWLTGAGLVAWLTFAGPSVLKALVKGVKHLIALLGKTNLGQGLNYTARDLWAQSLAVLSGTLPAVVIVDDLDRAKVDQQRSFLRALRRYSGLMGFAVVVCMDESEILAAPADPETPDELLRKTIEVELRMPDRTMEDIAHLAMVGMRELARINHDAARIANRISAVLGQAAQVADLARVLLWWPGVVSPRLVRRVLNDTGLAADQRQAWRADLWSALLRLQLLWAVAPNLRHHAAALQRALERNDAAVFSAMLAAVKGLDDARRAQALACFAATRAMQPDQGHGWQELLAGHRMAALAESMPAATPTTAAGAITAIAPDWRGDPGFDMVRLYGRLANVLRARAHGYWADEAWWSLVLTATPPAQAELPGLRYHRSTGAQRVDDGLDVAHVPAAWRADPAAYDAHCWLVWVSLLQHRSVAERLAIYDTLLLHWARSSPMATACLQREVLADAQAWQALTPAQRSQWAQLNQSAPGDNPSGPQRWLIALSKGDSPLALTLPGTDDLESLVRIRWLEAWVPDVTELDSNTPRGVLDAAFWPPVLPGVWQGSAWADQLHRHVQMFVRSRAAGAANGGVSVALPPTLSTAWRRAWPHLNLHQRLALIHAVAADVAGGPPVRLDRLFAWRQAAALDGGSDGSIGLPPLDEWRRVGAMSAAHALAGWWWLVFGNPASRLHTWSELPPGCEAVLQAGIDDLIGEPMFEQYAAYFPSGGLPLIDTATCLLIFRSALAAPPATYGAPVAKGLVQARHRRIIDIVRQREDGKELLSSLSLHDDPSADFDTPTA